MAEEQKNCERKINSVENIDVNNPDFYENVQCEIQSDLARLKKNVEVIINLRCKYLLLWLICFQVLF